MSDVTEKDLVENGTIPPEEFHDAIERIREIATFDIEIPADFEKQLAAATEGLVVPPEVINATLAALQVGHVVLQGPPGTGKSTLARALARAFNSSIYAVTAHEDWTTYDVIGRLELRLTEDRKEEIVPVNGALTESVIRCANNIVKHFDDPQQPQAEWLLIDELNRAHLDKAFGELFSVLGTHDLVPINLPHQKIGNRELVIPRRFRIIATLNSYDKQFVQNLSQAIRRRFTFITLNIPSRRPAGSNWQFDDKSSIPAIREFSQALLSCASRVARRDTSLDQAKFSKVQEKYTNELSAVYIDLVSRLFDFVEQIRYATESSGLPHLPIGTAQVIDTLELFLTSIHRRDSKINDAYYMDWAVSVKLIPLFEADILSPDQLVSFAEKLKTPFDVLTKRELLMIAASGMHFVPEN